MKKVVYAVVAVIILLSLLVGMYRLMNSRSYQLFGELTDQVDTDEKKVALTFDDGPTGKVEDILPLLNKYHAKATFFSIGEELEDHLEIGKEIVKQGHQIGNHTYSHQRMIFKSPSFIAQEIEKTNQIIRKTGFQGDIDFRPPNGKKLIGLPYYLMTHHIETIMWSIEPDTHASTVTAKVREVTKNARNGSIILLHPMYEKDSKELEVTEQILKNLTNKGYRFVTVNDLQKLAKSDGE
ncbi:polysaccharide deacetylase family protein [Halobacillus rhizosphaerae]|uniref:polysaccharide deacetylase family protein n=1 Tax=Halobacillus rhizosphaerae TaxID=3064889 RepID=UPI00398A5D12